MYLLHVTSTCLNLFKCFYYLYTLTRNIEFDGSRWSKVVGLYLRRPPKFNTMHIKISLLLVSALSLACVSLAAHASAHDGRHLGFVSALPKFTLAKRDVQVRYRKI